MNSTASRRPATCGSATPSALTPARPRPRNTASNSPSRPSSVTSRPRRWPVRTSMPPIDSSHVDLPLREVAGRLVGGEAVFVQAAELRAGLEQHDGVAAPRQAVRAGQPGRSGADHRDAPAALRGAREQRRARVGEQRIGRMALQRADLDRLVLVRVAHAGLFAQHLGRADAGAHAAERIGLEDRARRAAVVALRDALDEGRHVDPGRARRGARRVEAVVAALGLDQRLGAA